MSFTGTESSYQILCFILESFYKKGLKTFFMRATQLDMKFILLINVKMPTIVGILTFMSKINTSHFVFKLYNRYGDYLGF